MNAITLLVDDMAEKLATAEDAGFARALSVLEQILPEHTRYEMLMEMRAMHKMRVKLYAAQMRPRTQNETAL